MSKRENPTLWKQRESYYEMKRLRSKTLRPKVSFHKHFGQKSNTVVLDSKKLDSVESKK
jgi:hypothetical protein